MISAQEVKIFLTQAYYTSQRMQTLISKIYEYRTRAMQETARWNETSRGGKAVRSPQEVWIERTEDLEEQWKQLAGELIERDKAAHEMIELLTDQRQKCMLEDRHIWRLSWKKMEAKHHYTERQMRNIIGVAYRKLAVMISEDPEKEKRFRQFPLPK